MAQSPKTGGRRLTLAVSTAQRPDFKGALVAYVFDANGTLTQRADVVGGKLDVGLAGSSTRLPRVIIAPAIKDAPADDIPTIERLLKLGAYEPVLRQGGKLIDQIVIPGPIIDIWPFCFCWVRGRVVRASDNRPVCHARVHICEVDRIPIWILRLPDHDIYRLRDDLLEVLQNPPIPRPGPGPDPAPFTRLARLGTADRVAFNPQPDPPLVNVGRRAIRFDDAISRVALNPQPLPPKALAALPFELHNSLQSHSATTVRRALAANWQLIIPWLCFWPHWWWWFRCDELAVVETDDNGHFERFIIYPCLGDHPDLYFWVEYDLGAGFETVYRPPVACNTYWNYVCGSEVTIHLTDPRVPACQGPIDLPGKQVVVLSLGRTVAVREVGANGLTTAGEPFGEKLEPRVDFSVTNLAAAGIGHYQWSYQRLTGPDGATLTVDPSSPPIGAWKVMKRAVSRHYRAGTTYVPEPMGPFPAPLADAFKIQPVDPPAGGDEWIVLDEREDLATAHFETSSLPGSPASSASDDLAAGLYEIKLELFTGAGALVDWTALGIDLRITDQDAPFGVGTITSSPAPAGNRVIGTVAPTIGHTLGFRMRVRVDNNFCFAEIHPVGGSVSADPDCGFHTYTSPSDTVQLSFTARHPNHFATFGFSSGRGTGGSITETVTSGVAGLAASNGYAHGGFEYAKSTITVGTLTAPLPPSMVSCPNAAFWESLGVSAMATNGYGTLSGYDSSDVAAYALALPCPVCGDD